MGIGIFLSTYLLDAVFCTLENNFIFASDLRITNN